MDNPINSIIFCNTLDKNGVQAKKALPIVYNDGKQNKLKKHIFVTCKINVPKLNY